MSENCTNFCVGTKIQKIDKIMWYSDSEQPVRHCEKPCQNKGIFFSHFSGFFRKPEVYLIVMSGQTSKWLVWYTLTEQDLFNMHLCAEAQPLNNLRFPDDDQIGQKWGTALKKCSSLSEIVFDATWVFTRPNIFKAYLCAEPAPSRWWSNWPKMRNNTQKMFMRRMDFLAKVPTDRFLLYWCHFYMDGGGGSIAYTLEDFTVKIH